MKKGKVGFENKGLVILLGVLGVMIVGLVVGIVVVNVQRGDEVIMADIENEDDEEGHSSLPSVVSNIYNEIDALENPTIDDIVDTYQRYIDESESLEEEVALLDSRIYTIQNLDENNNYGALVLADAIKIDDIKMSIGSALQVINIANIYGDSELAAKYEAIVSDRERDEGVGNDIWETRG